MTLVAEGLLLRRDRAITVAVERQYALHIQCLFVALGMQHTIGMRHTAYSHLWPAWLYHTFPHCLMHGTARFSKEKKSY
jgi:hypothetical protein